MLVLNDPAAWVTTLMAAVVLWGFTIAALVESEDVLKEATMWQSWAEPSTRSRFYSRGDGGQGESLVPPDTRGSVSASRGAGRTLGASSYTQKRLSLSLSLFST